MLVGGGYPIQSWWGYPIQLWGVPYSVMVGGTSSSHEGYPIQSWWGGLPHPDLARGVVPQVPPTIQTWLAYPHHPDLAGVSPHHPDLAGVSPPTIQTWLGYPLPSRPGWGTLPHHLDLAGVPPYHPHLARVPPPTIHTWLGYPNVEVRTDKQTENSTFPHPSDAGGKNYSSLFTFDT